MSDDPTSVPATEPRTAIVTGASGALGGAVVTELLAAGLTVLGLDRLPAAAEDAAYRHAQVDLRDEGALVAALAGSLPALPPLTHLVSVAGGALLPEAAAATSGDPSGVDVETFRASIDANLTSQWIAIRSTLPYLDVAATAGEDRSITLTSSLNAISAQGMPAYSAAKAGVHGMMFGLVDPLGARGIRINVVAPGTARTPRTERLWAGSPGHFERLETGTAIGRLGTSEDMAQMYAALVLRLRHVTGQILVVDGGQTVVHRASAG